MSESREGGLRLCWCGHPMAYHPALPAWYGAKHTETKCTFCDCAAPEEMPDPVQQGMSWFQTHDEFDAWLARTHAWLADHGYRRSGGA